MYQSFLTTHPILWHGEDIAGQMNHVLTFCIVPLVWVNVGQLIYKGKYGSIKKNMTDGGETAMVLTKVKVPAVLLLEMTNAYMFKSS